MKQLAVCLLAISVATPVLAKGDAAAGEAKAKQVCAACHGPDGNTPTSPDFPKIGGQYYDYLLHTLKDYKTGARKNAIMAGQVQQLTAKDLEDLAAYFAKQPGTLYSKR